jgi:ferredoxin-type protein NapH
MRPARSSAALLCVAVLFTAAFAVGTVLLLLRRQPLFGALSLFCLSLGPCLLFYAFAPLRRKQPARRLVLFTGGLSILAFSLVTSANLDLEGFVLLLFEGVAGAAVGHTLATLVVGPALFGRILCGWGCWRAMALELLPLGRDSGRRAGLWRFLPIAGLLACLLAAALEYFVFGHHAGGSPRSPYAAGTLALLCGFAVYYAAAIALAFVLRDQRAFCKYLCPNLPILRLTSRLALLKITPDSTLCTSCGACSKICPMDIDVRSFAVSGLRVGTGECILCQRCVQACPAAALHSGFRPRRA